MIGQHAHIGNLPLFLSIGRFLIGMFIFVFLFSILTPRTGGPFHNAKR